MAALDYMRRREASIVSHLFVWRLTIALVFLGGVSATGAETSSPALTTILPATILPPSVPAGSYFKIRFHWKAEEPLGKACSVFVHVRDADGRMIAQADHEPIVAMDSVQWKGPINYVRSVGFPTNIADGVYRVVVGLDDKEGRQPLRAGPDVIELPGLAYEIGTVKVDRTTPRPRADTEGAKTLDLTRYEITFNEEFDGPLDVSARGPGTRWTAHTPWNGDFGDARFADPTNGFPFTISNGVLRIEARKDADGRWSAGLLCSNDAEGNGFSQQYGYFEMRAKLPGGPGVWPAFWLSSSPPRDSPNIEIDIIEFYGDPLGSYMSTVHVWRPGPHRATGQRIVTQPNEVCEDFHRYGALVEQEWITMYFDGVEVWKVKTPPEHQRPLMILLNLALGGGWPIDKTPNPSFMYVDYVRVYAK